MRRRMENNRNGVVLVVGGDVKMKKRVKGK